MAWPTEIQTFPTKLDNVDDVMAADVNDLQDLLVALQTYLGTNPHGSAADLKTRLAQALDDAGLLRFGGATYLTISSGAITTTRNFHRLIAEGGAADNLDTITAAVDGAVVRLAVPASGHVVYIRHDIGNIWCAGEVDIELRTPADVAELIYDGINSKWLAACITQSPLPNDGHTWSGRQYFSAGYGVNVLTVTTSSTLSGASGVVGVNAASGPITIDLPSITGSAIVGTRLEIIKVDASANAVTIDGYGTETINGALTHVLSTRWSSVSLIAASAGGWWIL